VVERKNDFKLEEEEGQEEGLSGEHENIEQRRAGN
jgi:hypothetical protein